MAQYVFQPSYVAFDLRFEEKYIEKRRTLVKNFDKNFGLSENSFYTACNQNIYKSNKRKYYLQHDPKYYVYKNVSFQTTHKKWFILLGFDEVLMHI